MSTILAACRASLLRHRRSKGLWIFVVAGLTCSRFFIPREHGFAVTVAVDEHLPILSSAVISASISIVLTTLLLPLLFILFRANSTRLQPWQVVEVSPASRIHLAVGAFLADAVVLTTLLLGFTFAAWIETWANLGWSATHPLQAAIPLWLGAFPALTGLAALRTLCAAFRLTRRAIGEVLFLVFWVASMSVPTAATRVHGRFAMYMTDFSGMIQPLRLFGSSLHRIEIGFGMPTLPGRVPFDVLSLLGTETYLISRLCWIALSLALVLIAGALYQPTGHLGTHCALGRHRVPNYQPTRGHLFLSCWRPALFIPGLVSSARSSRCCAVDGSTGPSVSQPLCSALLWNSAACSCPWSC